jgi:hypothetical protein
MMTRALTIPAVVLALTLGSVGLAAPVSRPKIAPALLKARLDAASETYRLASASWEQRVKGVSADNVYLWSVRWLEAQRAVSVQKADRVAACEAHLARMKKLAEMVDKVVQAGGLQGFQAFGTKFFRAEAEVWLAEAKAE